MDENSHSDGYEDDDNGKGAVGDRIGNYRNTHKSEPGFSH